MHCISARGEKKWAVSIGDEPVGLAVCHGLVWAASADGNAHRLDGCGRRLGQVRLGRSLTCLAALPNGLAAANGEGTITVLAPDGALKAAFRLALPCTRMVASGRALAVACGQSLTVLDAG